MELPDAPTAGRAGPVAVTRVGPEDWRRLRATRLAALADSPDGFGSTLAREQALDEAEWRRRAERPATFLASRGGTDIGMAGGYEIDGAWWVMGMWLTPAARGTGALEALVDACESVARDTGATRILLRVMADNPQGRRAYARLGYAETGAREHGRAGREELTLAKTLPSSG